MRKSHPLEMVTNSLKWKSLHKIDMETNDECVSEKRVDHCPPLTLDNLEEDRNPKPIYTESEMVSFGNFARSRWAKNNIYYCLSKWKEANQ